MNDRIPKKQSAKEPDVSYRSVEDLIASLPEVSSEEEMIEVATKMGLGRAFLKCGLRYRKEVIRNNA